MSTQLKPALQTSKTRSKPWGGSKLVNCFAEKADGDKLDDFAVMAIPGSVLFSTIGSSPVLGTHVMGTVLYAVSGGHLYSVDMGGVATKLGSIPGTGRVRMADNGAQLAIVSGTAGYVYSGGAITAPLAYAVSDVTYIDGYIVWMIAASDQFGISGLNNALSYDPLDIATVEGSPDDNIGITNDHRELQFYGKNSIEIWYNSGAADFPFERQGNAFIERGCFARDSIVKIDNSVHFVGDDLIVYRLDGYTPIRISTHSIEYALRNATDAWAFSYTQEGHKFYCLNTDVGSIAYDMATGAWHDRISDGQANWRMGSAQRCYGKTLLADSLTGKLYTPSLDTYTENGAAISVQLEPPPIDAGNRQRATMYSFELVCETGVGLNSGQGSDPQVMLTYSDDGGRNWSRELWRSMGVIGAYRTRAIWRKLGQFRTRHMKLVITDPVRRFVLSYHAEVG